jgi:MFS family permease
MTSHSRLPPRAWLIVALLWFVGCFNYLVRMMLTTMHGSIVAAIPMNEAHFGLLTSAFLWTYALCSPLGGFMADRFSRSRVILVSMLAWSAVTWLTAYARNFPELVAMRALLGMSEACYLPAALALISDYHRGPTRSLATAVHMTGMGIGIGSILGALGGSLAEHHTWHYAFSLMGTVGIAYWSFLVFILRDSPREGGAGAAPGADGLPRVGFGAAIASLFSRGPFILALTFWGILGLDAWLLGGWLPVYMKEHFHLGQGAAGWAATGYSFTAGLVGALVGGAWADRWSRRRFRARIFVPAIGLCLCAPGILLTARTDVLVFALAGLVLFGFFRSFVDCNMMPILCLVSDPRYRATGYGILNCFACVIGGLAIYAGGALRDHQVNLSKMFVFAAATLVLCAGILLLIRPRAPASAGSPT